MSVMGCKKVIRETKDIRGKCLYDRVKNDKMQIPENALGTKGIHGKVKVGCYLKMVKL